jgi:hypothetical protein
MSQLETFEHPFEDNVVALGGNFPGVCLKPGDWVSHKYRKGSYGMLVANGDDFIMVLWCVESRSSLDIRDMNLDFKQEFLGEFLREPSYVVSGANPEAKIRNMIHAARTMK